MRPTLAPMDCSYLADVSSIPLARAAVTRFASAADIAGDQLDDVRLCVSEAVSNVAIHAYANREAGSVRVRAEASEGALLIRVTDDGRGLHGASPNPGLGVGLHLLLNLSDGLVVRERPSGGVEVHIRFDLRRGEPVSGGLSPRLDRFENRAQSALGFRI